MFLKLLGENRKKDFIELCGYAADADGVVVEQEKTMIYAYCKEMGIPEEMPQKEKALDEIISDIRKNASEQEKKIIIFELIGLLYADDAYTAEEENFMQKIVEGLEFDLLLLNHIISLLEIYKSIYKEIYTTVAI